MYRVIPVLFLLSGCASQSGIFLTDDDLLDDTDVEEDFSMYDGATLRIVEPSSADFLALDEVHDFEAELIGADGEPLDYDEIVWTSSADPAWELVGLRSEDDTLDVGLHDITAQVSLPNGDRLAHTVGGILVQSIYAGTYVGLFTSDVTYDAYQIPCAGTATLVVDPYGEQALGEASCVASLMGYDMELHYLFDLENQEGRLSGVAAADIFGWFQVDFDADGSLAPEDDGLNIGFGGDVAGTMTVAGDLGAERISLDAGLE